MRHGMARLCRAECTPHFLFETPKRKCAVHGGKEKVSGLSWPLMGQLTHTKERPVRTAGKIQKSPTGCAENPQMTSKYIPASAGAAFIWLQRGYPLPPFPLPLPILWGWFPKAGAEAPGLCVVGGPGRIETPWCFSSGVWGGFFSRKECAPRPCSGNYPLREQGIPSAPVRRGLAYQERSCSSVLSCPFSNASSLFRISSCFSRISSCFM